MAVVSFSGSLELVRKGLDAEPILIAATVRSLVVIAGSDEVETTLPLVAVIFTAFSPAFMKLSPVKLKAFPMPVTGSTVAGSKPLATRVTGSSEIIDPCSLKMNQPASMFGEPIVSNGAATPRLSIMVSLLPLKSSAPGLTPLPP